MGKLACHSKGLSITLLFSQFLPQKREFNTGNLNKQCCEILVTLADKMHGEINFS